LEINPDELSLAKTFNKLTTFHLAAYGNHEKHHSICVSGPKKHN